MFKLYIHIHTALNKAVERLRNVLYCGGGGLYACVYVCRYACSLLLCVYVCVGKGGCMCVCVDVWVYLCVHLHNQACYHPFHTLKNTLYNLKRRKY